MKDDVFDTRKIDTLEKIYELFDHAAGGFELACHEGCDDCCTCNVTATSLETSFLFSHLEKNGISHLTSCLETTGSGKRYRPGMTTNGFARATLSGEAVEEEENDPAWGRCPMLEGGRCRIYEARPFGCRSMLSQKPCRETGWADMPPLALSLSTIVLQYIEHLDKDGFSGNFLDVAGRYLGRERAVYLSFENINDSDTRKIFLRNREIPALMVPPEHRSQAASMIRELNALMQAVM
ncbi:MAG: hypothetical protein HUN04_23140 [Desulfobacter sp.]|nr:MAG: hypothetical protein HUN04_23140 [Desulfobacter sp.]